MFNFKARRAAVEVIQDVMVGMLFYIPILILVYVAVEVLTTDVTLSIINGTLDVNAWYVFVQAILISALLGSVHRLFRFGFTRGDIFQSYILIGVLVVSISFSILIALGIIINAVPLLDGFNEQLNMSMVWNVALAYVVNLGYFFAGLLISIGFYKGLRYAFGAMFLAFIFIFSSGVLTENTIPELYQMFVSSTLIIIMIVFLWMMLRTIEVKMTR